MEVTSRYEALGIPLPDPRTMCKTCQGTAYVPIDRTLLDELGEPWRSLWHQAEAENPSDDNWHFVKCPHCGGTGKRGSAKWKAIAARTVGFWWFKLGRIFVANW
ncbi:MAG: hypothetical protein AAGF24_08165 [Cyanobacteria bacterium P01_H01_bin.121]